MTNVIVTENLIKNYGPKRVVDHLSLKIPEGCVYGFLGRNGAGKSTTIRMLMGMVRPDYGRIELLGEDLATLRPETRARIAYIAEGHPLYGSLRVSEMVAFARSFYPHWNKDLVQRILDHFELSPRQRVRRLSRGQQAQVSLAIAMGPDPELLILDDPTLGLDTVVRRDFLESLIQIIQRRGRTILFSSHVLGDVERVATRIGIMDRGVLRVDCPTEHFRETLRKVVCEFRGQPPDYPGELPPLKGVVSARVVGSTLELLIVGYGPDHEAALQALEPRFLEAVELNLEDAFIEYTRGPRRPIPLFFEETRHVEGDLVERLA
jgi:ABC-2 type transport system ATP-binding protein